MKLPDPITPAIEAVLQIAPRASLSAATAACAQRNGPIKLVVRIRDQKSSVRASRSGNGIGVGVAGVPALLTRKSSRPSASIALATMRSASPGLPTSPGDAMIRYPCTLRSSTWSGPRGSSGRWLSATAAPAGKNLGGGEPDAGGGAGDEHGLAGKIRTDHLRSFRKERQSAHSMPPSLRLSSR